MNRFILFATLFFPLFSVHAQFCFEPNHFVSGNFPYNVIVADFTGNGVLDLATPSFSESSNRVIISVGNGDGTFNSLPGNSNFPVGMSPRALVSDDFNDDGILDIAVVNHNSNDISILLGTGGGYMETGDVYPSGISQFPRAMVTADFNEDDIPDLLVVGLSNISLFHGNGDGSFAAPIVNSIDGSGGADVVAADFNNDGHIDIAVTYMLSNKIAVLFGDGLNGFLEAVFYDVGERPIGIATYDIDNDGELDILVCNAVSKNISLLMGQTNGTFADTVNYSVPNAPEKVAVADFNNDGFPDLVVTSYHINGDDGEVYIMQGNADFSFGEPETFVSGAYSTGIAIADLNADGKPDFVTSNYNSGIQNLKTISVFLNCTSPLSFVNSIDYHDNWNVYPNPFQGQFQLENKKNDIVRGKASLFNVVGKVVFETENVVLHQLSIDISTQPKGVYFLHLYTPTGKVVKRLVHN